jgi:hypothetical protein
MKILLDVKDNKADFILELLHNFSFVKTKAITGEKAQPIEDIKEAVDEMKLIMAGQKNGKDARAFLNEL